MQPCVLDTHSAIPGDTPPTKCYINGDLKVWDISVGVCCAVVAFPLKCFCGDEIKVGEGYGLSAGEEGELVGLYHNPTLTSLCAPYAATTIETGIMSEDKYTHLCQKLKEL